MTIKFIFISQFRPVGSEPHDVIIELFFNGLHDAFEFACMPYQKDSKARVCTFLHGCLASSGSRHLYKIGAKHAMARLRCDICAFAGIELNPAILDLFAHFEREPAIE